LQVEGGRHDVGRKERKSIEPGAGPAHLGNVAGPARELEDSAADEGPERQAADNPGEDLAARQAREIEDRKVVQASEHESPVYADRARMTRTIAASSSAAPKRRARSTAAPRSRSRLPN